VRVDRMKKLDFPCNLNIFIVDGAASIMQQIPLFELLDQFIKPLLANSVMMI
jgi:hypothetical protein